MVGKFWEAAGSKLAERWAAVSAPALVFWLGGVLAWAHSRAGLRSLDAPAARLADLSLPVQLVALLTALTVVVTSGLLVRRLAAMALRALCAAHWPRLLRPVRDLLVERQRRRLSDAQQRFQQLSPAVHDGSATPEQNAEHGALTARLRRFPSSGDPLPTRTGNILRAAETRPTDKYGLDAVAVWPHLWLLLPDTPRKDIATARLSLDASTAACVWGLAFTAFAPWTLWAVPVGLTVAVAALAGWVPERAETYADLVEASFDLHRGALYGQLRWPLPGNPQDERVQGRRVTTYLVRGLSGSTPPFTP
ncbi:hypothetical protein ACFZCP_29060 [Streptomyces sp. NPDC007971]|uniref:hypothetical protein n=1 Tax=unclassified Streptomyces TaxID=2593676 RepID=UPI003443BE25